MDNAVGLRLLIDPSEAYDQISDCYGEQCYEHLGTEVKQYTPFRWSGGIIKLLRHMIMHVSVIRTKFQVCKLQLKHMKLT